MHIDIGNSADSLKIEKRNLLVLKINSRIKRVFRHEDFYDSTCEKLITGPMPKLELYLENARQIRSRKKQSIPECMRACYEQPLLTCEQEKHLFRKYNFYKHRAATNLEKNKIIAACKELKLADACRKHLTVANVRLSIPIIRKYRTNRNYEDLVSESYFLICRAVDYFDWTRGFKFSTYATWSIVRTLGRTASDMIKQDLRHQQTNYDFGLFHPSSIDKDQEEKITNDHYSKLVKKLLDYSRPRERDVLKLRFMHDETLLSIANKMNLSKERVRQIEKSGLERIAVMANDMGWNADEIWQ